MSDPAEVTITGPIDLIAIVPHLLGYEPGSGDVVVIGMRDDTLIMTACTNFRGIRTRQEHDAVVGVVGKPVSHTNIDTAAIVGYGGPEHVGAGIDSLRDFLSTRGIRIVDAMRVFEKRLYPHLPAGGGTTPTGAAAGIPFDTATTTVTAAMVLNGSVTEPNRAALADQFLPVTGAERADMHAATLRARHRLQHLTAGIADPAATIAEAGRAAAAMIYEHHRSGDRPTDDEAAWLIVLLTDTAVRDHVWRQTHGHHGHLTLWTDLTRRAEPDLVAAPATLLAFTAWQMGNGPVAAIALQRALNTDPAYRMARLLQLVLFTGMPPTAVGGRFLTEDPLAAKRPVAG
ncbi:DUF4192 domain-containing protein [Virgisporangium aurantiacum]|uniref:DUF4192 domain-containing protein n=1 Tax=Virgisporangium aurantiacum TaxID=175570 RepID=A0A8J3ZNQ9_9ACTN|nr:DUF4192 domain-containing protein [Virgisporangium aurantiacum]GIJ64911.1 hypothetical protein Vau01_124270 [Virgisporangium aurantiacum]